MTPRALLAEAAAAEAARIYSATLRENTARKQAELDTPEAIQRRRAIAESIQHPTSEQHLRRVV